ncbi:TPA: hypothetical protein DCL30_03840 [Candidatus Peribacteria bacterium]|nr:MAG: hypothetical protein A2529_00665 [Candidatus Peribacteria bacterium RIFOXYD2_FULL_58_15]HAI98637.1 hypothetical protein [Candidatus Peribacteria bacterium]HAS34350.1 hypothetical protein [Candidatus Peribacteria bacterium]
MPDPERPDQPAEQAAAAEGDSSIDALIEAAISAQMKKFESLGLHADRVTGIRDDLSTTARNRLEFLQSLPGAEKVSTVVTAAAVRDRVAARARDIRVEIRAAKEA